MLTYADAARQAAGADEGNGNCWGGATVGGGEGVGSSSGGATVVVLEGGREVFGKLVFTRRMMTDHTPVRASMRTHADVC
jgi:hypothetical protein